MGLGRQVGFFVAALVSVVLAAILGDFGMFPVEFWVIIAGVSLSATILYLLLQDQREETLRAHSRLTNVFSWMGLVLIPSILIISLTGCAGGEVLCGVLNFLIGVSWIFVGSGIFIFSSYKADRHLQSIKQISFYVAIIGIAAVLAASLYKVLYLSVLCESPMCMSFDKETFFTNFIEHSYDGSRNPTPGLGFGPQDGYYTLSTTKYLSDAANKTIVKQVAAEKDNPGICRFYGHDWQASLKVQRCAAPIFGAADDAKIKDIITKPIGNCSKIASSKELIKEEDGDVTPFRFNHDAQPVKQFYGSDPVNRNLVDSDFWGRYDVHDPGHPNTYESPVSTLLKEARRDLIVDDAVVVRENCVEKQSASEKARNSS